MIHLTVGTWVISTYRSAGYHFRDVLGCPLIQVSDHEGKDAAKTVQSNPKTVTVKCAGIASCSHVISSQVLDGEYLGCDLVQSLSILYALEIADH